MTEVFFFLPNTSYIRKLHMLWFKFTSGSNFLNQFIFFKLVHIF